MGRCSPPFGIGRAWLDKYAGDICDYHDSMWVKREWAAKVKADFVATGLLLARGLALTACGLLALPYFLIPGTLYWMWKKYKEALRKT